MPSTRVLRVDLPILVRRSEDEQDVILRIGSSAEARFPARMFANPADLRQGLLALGEAGLRGELDRWRERCAAASPSEGLRVVPRVTVESGDAELAHLPWEEWLDGLVATDAVALSGGLVASREVVVRVTPVWPRAHAIPLTLPLRFVHVGIDDASFDALEQRVWGGNPDAYQSILLGVPAKLADLERLRAKWPTADVLHFDATDWPEEAAPLLSTADPSRVGTLGWLARLTERWQTRLVVLDDTGSLYWRGLTALAAALAARGGPAVLVRDTWSIRAPLDGVYHAILHDQPLETVLEGEVASLCSLHVGAGREDALRLSSIVTGLVDAETTILQEARRRRQRTRRGTLAEARDAALNLARRADALISNLSRPGGALELGSAVDLLRQGTLIGVESVRPAAGPPDARRQVGGPLEALERAAAAPARRSTRCSFHEPAERRLPVRLEQTSARLLKGRTYQFGLRITGDEDTDQVIGVSALLEEVFKWQEGEEGAWIEVGVTGIDFEVAGDPVQELWLPRDAPSEPLFFAVRPRAAGAAWLRVCLYHRNTVIQSIRVAAFVLAEGQDDPPAALRQTALADALGVPEEVVGDVGYLARFEYGGLSAIDAPPERPKRALSVVCNHSNRGDVFTVKGDDIFDAVKGSNMAVLVSNVRLALEKVSTKETVPGKPESSVSCFGSVGDLNAGSEAQLDDALCQLACAGGFLFDAIFARRLRERIAATLARGVQTIEIAQVVLENAIPWSVIYDGGTAGALRPKEDRIVCRAALGSREPVERCGALPACPLHETNQAERARRGLPVLAPSAVVCPLRFWGFRHRIELPVRQHFGEEAVDPGAPDPTAVAGVVRCDRPAKLFAAIDGKLPRAEEHLAALVALLRSPQLGTQPPTLARTLAEVRAGLSAPDLDVVYFYCHTECEYPPGMKQANLVFRARTGAGAEHLTVSELMEAAWGVWPHRPLVFINGCRTGAFTAGALSMMVIAMVRDCGAGGVVATEAKVWEAFADEFSRKFLESFLPGRSAADALLEARWSLLRRNNPLGLVYTLYASADLALHPPA